jgi:DNA-binding NarL/FixJ family response regulator
VALADDHPMVRYGLRVVLDGADDLVVVGEASNGRDLLALVERTSPDVVVTDLSMPDLDGAAAAAQLKQRHPGVAVLVLTMHDDDESVFAAMRAGARGYLLKGADAPVLLATVRALARGETVFGDAVGRRIVDFFVGGTDAYGARVFPELTAREREVLDLMAAGMRNSEIAARLGMSEKTLRNHISAVFAKLAVPDRSAAIVRAREAGLGRSLSSPPTSRGPVRP